MLLDLIVTLLFVLPHVSVWADSTCRMWMDGSHLFGWISSIQCSQLGKILEKCLCAVCQDISCDVWSTAGQFILCSKIVDWGNASINRRPYIASVSIWSAFGVAFRLFFSSPFAIFTILMGSYCLSFSCFITILVKIYAFSCRYMGYTAAEWLSIRQNYHCARSFLV